LLTDVRGAYALGAGLAGPAPGFASVAVLALVPDASTYGLRNGFLSFHFHMLVTPGRRLCDRHFLASAALLLRWTRDASPRPLLASAALALVRSGFACTSSRSDFPPGWPARRWRRARCGARLLLFAAGGFLAFLLFVMAFYAATDSDFALTIFLDVLHDRKEPTAYDGVYWALLTEHGQLLAALVGVPARLPGVPRRVRRPVSARAMAGAPRAGVPGDRPVSRVPGRASSQ
jgi:hypothetical protein